MVTFASICRVLAPLQPQFHLQSLQVHQALLRQTSQVVGFVEKAEPYYSDAAAVGL
jgi:hypothetical protein